MDSNSGMPERTGTTMPDRVYLHVGFSSGMATAGSWSAKNEHGDKMEYTKSSRLAEAVALLRLALPDVVQVADDCKYEFPDAIAEAQERKLAEQIVTFLSKFTAGKP